MYAEDPHNKHRQIAKTIYLLRTQRAIVDPLLGRLCGEPTWDILLDLYVAHVDHRGVSISSACRAGGAAPTTGLRHLLRLEEEGLVKRRPHPDDGRSFGVYLSASGVDLMTRTMQRFLDVFANLAPRWRPG